MRVTFVADDFRAVQFLLTGGALSDKILHARKLHWPITTGSSQHRQMVAACEPGVLQSYVHNARIQVVHADRNTAEQE